MSSFVERRRRRSRGQGGFTLMEVLVTVAISSVIMVPLLAWMTLAYRTQVEVTHNSARTAARNLLAAYLPRDVGSSASVDGVPVDCAAAPASTDVATLSMVAPGASPRRTVYLLRPVDSRSGVLVRRTCDGAVIDDTEVVENVALPASASVTAACEGNCNARFGRVNLTVNLVDGGGTIVVTASRRVGADQ